MEKVAVMSPTISKDCVVFFNTLHNVKGQFLPTLKPGYRGHS